MGHMGVRLLASGVPSALREMSLGQGHLTPVVRGDPQSSVGLRQEDGVGEALGHAEALRAQCLGSLELPACEMKPAQSAGR